MLGEDTEEQDACTDVDTCPHEDEGKSSSWSSRFEKDGFIHVRQQLPKDVIHDWKLCSDRVIKAIFELLFNNGHAPFPTPEKPIVETGQNAVYGMQLGVKNGFREIVMRSPGRFEISLTECSKILDFELPDFKGFLTRTTALSLVPLLLQTTSWDEVQICNTSLVVALPNASQQGWHADGGHVSVEEHLPCHCLNVFIPLTDIPLELGPTEFRPGTQYHTRNLAPMMLLAKARKVLRPPTTPVPMLGDVIIFDYRILHRGRANVSPRPRAILVLTVSKPWFKDVLNFPARSIVPVGPRI